MKLAQLNRNASVLIKWDYFMLLTIGIVLIIIIAITVMAIIVIKIALIVMAVIAALIYLASYFVFSAILGPQQVELAVACAAVFGTICIVLAGRVAIKSEEKANASSCQAPSGYTPPPMPKGMISNFVGGSGDRNRKSDSQPDSRPQGHLTHAQAQVKREEKKREQIRIQKIMAREQSLKERRRI